MSDWLPLSGVEDWLANRYPQTEREASGWGSDNWPRALAELIRSGEIGARHRDSRGGGWIRIPRPPEGADFEDVSSRGEVFRAWEIKLHPAEDLIEIDAPSFGLSPWDTTLHEVGVKVSDLAAHCDDIAGAAGTVADAKGLAPSRNSREREAALSEWIAGCGEENYKVAFAMLRVEWGNNAPKRESEFLPTWRKVKGYRGRGRLKSPD